MSRHHPVRSKGAPSSTKSGSSHLPHHRNKKANTGHSSLTIIAVVAVLIAIVVAAFLKAYEYYEAGRLVTPLGSPLASTESQLGSAGFWGSYRPGLYLGLKTRSPAPDLATGLMWVNLGREAGLRHWCEQQDELEYGWLKHDGKSFGIQSIRDDKLNVTTSFVVHDDHKDWTTRISVDRIGRSDDNKGLGFTLKFYVAMDEGGERQGVVRPVFDEQDKNFVQEIVGSTPAFENFGIKFVEKGSVQRHFYSVFPNNGLHEVGEEVKRHVRIFDDRYVGLVPDSNPSPQGHNVVVYQVYAKTPFQLDIQFSSDRSKRQESSNFDQMLEQREKEFDEKFESLFKLKAKGLDGEHVKVAKAALSNMLGGIGYFHGRSLVSSDGGQTVMEYWPASLYSSVPSRSFFPRGFLWDEGFHNLLIATWDSQIASDIVAHWLDLINVDGWIPREQILGSEARARVPAEFVVQHSRNANPPTLLLTLDKLLSLKPESSPLLELLWPRLETWYHWFNSTQAGSEPGSYRWRGRNSTSDLELNPKSLTSGLDDYPRASHPDETERHVDLRCWMALFARQMANIAGILGNKERQKAYGENAAYLYDNALLDAQHWSEEHGAYLDFGLHTEQVRLVKMQPAVKEGKRPKFLPPPIMKRVVSEEPKHNLVPQIGYVSLFPLLLQVLDAQSPRLGSLLTVLEDPQQLWTPYGLRSLSKSSSLYMKRNTEHDAPYWRGPIWINMNFLAVRALKHYSLQAGPHQARCETLYKKLKEALVANIVQEYKRTGFLWEQYNDSTGKGQGCKPFTGWTSLIVLIMADLY